MTNIIEAHIADFCEEGTTVTVVAEADDNMIKFHVQTVDGLYRPSMGCLISTDDDTDIDTDGDEYSAFDLDLIIKEAEENIQSRFEDYKDYEIQDCISCYKVLRLNTHNYVNKYSSPYTFKYETIKEFGTEEEAKAFIDSM